MSRESKVKEVTENLAPIDDVVQFSLAVENKQYTNALSRLEQLLQAEPENKMFQEYKKVLLKVLQESSDTDQESSTSDSDFEGIESKYEVAA